MKLLKISLLLCILNISAQTSIDAVYFAQTHVLKPTDAYFKLTSSRKALIKVHVVNPSESSSPSVTVKLTAKDGSTTTLSLTGPANLPASIPDGPGVVQHTLDNCFSTYIPAEWMQPGLDVEINAGGELINYNNLNIGPPHNLTLIKSQVSYFSDNEVGNFTDGFEGWEDEFLEKLPLANFEVRKVAPVYVSEYIVLPTSGKPAYRVRSREEYTALSGNPYPTEARKGLLLNSALRAAARADNLLPFYMTFNYVTTNLGIRFNGTGGHTNSWVFLHELAGHGMSLPHWATTPAYPYKGDMYGISADGTGRPHAGPTWGFDSRNAVFIPPTVQTEGRDRALGAYKEEPMAGGGGGTQEAGFLWNHFSDYSAHQINNFLESRLAVWDESNNDYYFWNSEDGDYTTPVTWTNELSYPSVRDVEVYSLLAEAFASDLQKSLVNPPFGPYISNMIRLFDPRVAKDRADAQSIFGQCDFTLRYVQGGTEKYSIIERAWDPNANPTNPNSLYHNAINVPANEGEVTEIELLLTPNVQLNGLDNPKSLYIWSAGIENVARFYIPPTADDFNAEITMTASSVETPESGYVEYLFTETSGNPGGTSSGWQSSPVYTNTGLAQGTTYTYTVTVRDASGESTVSEALSATTAESVIVETLTPTNGATNIDTESNLEVNFNRNIIAGTGSITLMNLTLETEYKIDINDASKIQISANTLTINPMTALVPLSHYAVKIDANAIVGTDGKLFGGINDTSVWNFYTGLGSEDISAKIYIRDVSPAGQTSWGERYLSSSFGDVSGTSFTPVEALTTISLNNLDLTSLGGTSNETIAIDVSYEAIGGDRISFWRYGQLAVNGGAWEFGISDDQAITARIEVNEALTTFEGQINANFFKCITKLNANHGAVITHEGGVEIAKGPGLLVPVPFDESPFLTIEPIDDSQSTVMLDGYEIVVELARLSSPKIASLFPVDNTTNVSPDTTELTITFDNNIQTSSGNIIIENLTDQTSKIINASDASQVAATGNTLTISPTEKLASFKRYAIRLESDAINDMSGNQFSGINNNTSWNFTTGVSTGENSATFNIFVDGFGALQSNQSSRALRSDVGTLHVPTESTSIREYSVSGLDFTSIGGSNNETIVFDVTYAQEGGEMVKVTDYSALTVLGNLNDNINTEEALIATVQINNAKTTYGGGLQIGFVELGLKDFNATDNAIIRLQNGEVTQSGDTSNNIIFDSSIYFEAKPSTGDFTLGSYVFQIVAGIESSNTPPILVNNPIQVASAVMDIFYSENLASHVLDAEGDLLIFSKISGPDWLVVGAEGSLSGTPGESDLGENRFTFEVTDGNSSPVAFTIDIVVGEIVPGIIYWGTATNLIGAGDISTNGVLVEAYYPDIVANNGNVTTLNTVDFVATSNLGNEYAGGPTTDDVDYNKILTYRAETGTSDPNRKINIHVGEQDGNRNNNTGGALTVGNRYEIQLWNNDSRGNYKMRVSTTNDGGITLEESVDIPYANYVTGVFIAKGNEERLIIQYLSNSNILENQVRFGAYQIRDITNEDIETYLLTVESGTGSGGYEENTIVSLMANIAAPGKEFDKWVVESGNPTIEDEFSEETTLLMPAEPVSIHASYKDITLSAAMNNIESDLFVWHNRYLNLLEVKSNVAISDLQLFSLDGKLLLSKFNLNTTQNTLTIDSLSQGIYILKVKSITGKLVFKKIIIR